MTHHFFVFAAQNVCQITTEFAAFSDQSPLAASGWSDRVLNFSNGDDGDGHGTEELKGFMSA